MKKKCLYIAHSYHGKTQSNKFLSDYLAEFYDVEIVYNSFNETGKDIDYSIINDSYYVIVFFNYFHQ